MLGIYNLKNKLPAKISGGQQQRCAIARALASDNNIILADEPTGASEADRIVRIEDGNIKD